jgi:hypothetical protein
MVNYAHNILNKHLQEVNIEDLTNYFSEKRLETNTLEFKSFQGNATLDDSMVKVLKTICGFLNGSGGLLILGAPGKKVDGNIDYFQGELTPLSIQKSVDWFINKISSSISPMPINIVIKIVQAGQNYVYLFEVQESQYKPHQNGHIYYIRLDGQTKPAPHYIVQSLMRQITYPDIRVAIRFNRFFDYAGQTLSKMAFAIYNFSQLQNEENYNYAITLVGGAKFFGWQDNQYGNEISLLLEGAQLIHKPILQALHSGIPYIKTFNILIPIDEQEIKILITYGGKRSPSKNSIYTLSLLNLDFANPQTNVTINIDNELMEAKQSIDDELAFFRNNELV